MTEGERKTSISHIIEVMEEEKLEAEKELFVVLIYKTILGRLNEQQIDSVTGKKVIEIIEEGRETSNWVFIQHEALLLRRDRLIKKGAILEPSVHDIRGITEELVLECKKLNKNTKRHCSFLEKNLFQENSE